MKKHIPYILTLAVVTGWVLAINSPVLAQTTDTLLMDSIDQSEFPQITAQPVDQSVPVGSSIALSVQANNADGYQWRRNGAAMDGQTNSSLVIEQVVIEDAGAYSCDVSQSGGDPVPTRSAALNVMSAAMAGGPITVYGAPQANGGTKGTCPGSYAGYVNYTKTISQGWGWAPSTNSTTVFIAADGGGRTDTKIAFGGKFGDTGCNQTAVPVPNPPFSPCYRFTIYFPNNVPTTNYPIILTGFCQ
jgi:hypothetical protein